MYDHLTNRIYEQYKIVENYLIRKGVDKADAPDFAAEIVIMAVESVHQLRDPDKLCAWVGTIAKNYAAKQLKEVKVKRHREVVCANNGDGSFGEDILQRIPGEWSVEKTILANEEKQMLAAALSSLSGIERAVFLMRNIGESKYSEIAGVLNINANTVKSIHFRSCKKLRKQCERMYDFLTRFY